MSKKTIYGLIAAAVVLIVVVMGATICHESKEKIDKKSPAVSNVVNVQNQKNSKIEKKDTALFSRSSGIHEISLPSKEVKIYAEGNVDFLSFAGLPEETDSVLNSVAFVSQDKTQAIVVSAVLDENAASGFDDSISIKDADEFICNKVDKNCVKTDILASAYNATGSKSEWFNDQSIGWQNWDSTNNILYGNLNSEENGSVSPVYIFNIADKSISQTKDSDFQVPNGAFSPSLEKFVLIDASSKWNLSLYDSKNLSEPLKKIDVSAMIDASDDFNVISSVAWSKDEKKLVLTTDNQIYTLNLDSQELSLKYTDTVDDTVDTTQDDSDLGIDSSAVSFSTNEKYIVFVDYDRGNLPYEEDKSYTVLKAIDLENNDAVIELLREEDISLSMLQ